MIRVALRQFRAEAVTSLVVLVVLATVLAVTGWNVVHVNDAFRSTCRAVGDCATASNPVVDVDKPLQNALLFVVVVAPALVGLFFGAPLIARELETGTFRLAWTQSVTRKRWLAVKLGLIGLAAIAFAALVTWMADWWASPIEAVNADRFGPGNFSLQGVAPIGYAAFAFALGASAGALLRQTVAAMAFTGAGFAAARLVVTKWVRPNLASPVRRSLPLSVLDGPKGPGFGFGGPGNVVLTPAPVGVPNGWVFSTTILDKAGHAPTSQYLLHACPVLDQVSKELAASGGKPPAGGPGPAQLAACAHTFSATLHTVITFQPAGRFWPFQWAEMGIFLAAALALCGLAYWRLGCQYV